MHRVLVEEADFDVASECKRLSDLSKQIGGLVTFTGYVRNENNSVSSLFLEHYPGMTEKQITQIIEEAAAKWDVIGATVVHRVGELAPGEQIVFVAVASQHRGDAFSASEYIIDFLKTRATFWKRETIASGQRWVESRQSDQDALSKWEEGSS